MGLDNDPRTQFDLEESPYPIRSVTGIARWQNNELILISLLPQGRYSLNEAAAVILLSCDGVYTVKELVYAIQTQYPMRSRGSVATDIYKALAELADNSLITFSKVKSEAVPVVRVRFCGFRPGFDAHNNYFTSMMADLMLMIIVEDGKSDLDFQWVDESGTSVGETRETDCIRVFVSNGQVRSDLDRFDFAFSPFQVKAADAPRHCRIPCEAYAGSSFPSAKRKVSKQFYDFLFPIDRDELHFSFGDAPDGLDIAATGTMGDQAVRGDTHEPSDSTFHVCLVADRTQAEGLFALVNSILTNTETPERFRFHILVDANSDFYQGVLVSRFKIVPRYEIKSFRTTDKYQEHIHFLEAYMRVEGGARETSRIRNTMNFARIYLPELFPDVDVGLYLDVDMIVQTDLARLYPLDLTSAIVAAPLNRDFEHYHTDLGLTGKGFNAGFLLIDFVRWREEKVTQAIEKVMIKHKQRKLFGGGTQSLLNVVFYRQCIDLNHLWNVTDLGFREDLDRELLEQARILHWNGGRKPWLDDGLYKNLWDNYRIDVPRD